MTSPAPDQSALICRKAAKILLNELSEKDRGTVYHGAEQKALITDDGHLFVTLTITHVPDIKSGEGQTIEATDHPVNDGRHILQQLGAVMDDVETIRPTNAEGDTTVARTMGVHVDGALFQHHHDTVTFKVPLDKMDIQKAKRIVQEHQLARELQRQDTIARGRDVVGRRAVLEFPSEDFYYALRKKLQGTAMEDFLDPLFPQTPRPEVSIDVGITGIKNATLILEAWKEITNKIVADIKTRHDQRIDDETPGMREVPAKLHQLLSNLKVSVGAQKGSVQRVFGHTGFKVVLEKPISMDAFLALEDKLTVAANQLQKPAKDTMHYFIVMLPENTIAPPEPKPPSVQDGFAGLFYKAPSKEPPAKPLVSDFTMAVMQTDADFVSHETSLGPVDVHEAPPSEIVSLIEKLSSFDWSRLAAVGQHTGPGKKR